MKVRVRVREVVLLGSAWVSWSAWQMVTKTLVLSHSAASFLTLIHTGITGAPGMNSTWKSKKPSFFPECVDSVHNYGMRTDECCPLAAPLLPPCLTPGWPVWAGGTGRGAVQMVMRKCRTEEASG